jgi:hypothetical protein
MKIILALILFFFSSCGTPPKAPEAPEPVRIEIDYPSLQSRLGIESKPDRVGYQEVVFDACEFSNLLPPFKDCHHAYYILAQFQLSCRASEESNSILSASDLQPLMTKPLKWRAGKNYGEIITDPAGYAQIQTISEKSMKRQQLRVSTGKDFLVIVAGQSTNIVTPPSWCE